MHDAELVKAFLAAIPYAQKLGVTAALGDDGRVTCTMPFNDNHIGNKQLPALHGGSLASFLEITAILELARQRAAIQQVDSVEAAHSAVPLPVNVTVQYLRSAGALPCTAEATVLKIGRRTSTVFAQVWQDDAAKPVTSMTGVFIQPKA
ncbi:MAG: PaaI family thioesterase [PS1 clade bacterium]|uniref:PaaI family thioesterase n=1 Tax=PS1 clade bacterium TaxID=2175152 RepID=A0A937HNF8_9PROT|nr:PaaI family thioesterase [PS1 clade bacterium]